jgi:hypothetical protein
MNPIHTFLSLMLTTTLFLIATPALAASKPQDVQGVVMPDATWPMDQPEIRGESTAWKFEVKGL